MHAPVRSHVPETSAALIDSFEAFDFSRIDGAPEFQRDLVAALRNAARYGYTDGFSKLETGAVYEGKAAETGHEEDEGVLVLARVRTIRNGTRDDWTDGQAIIDSPISQRVDGLSFVARANGKVEDLSRVRTDTPVRYAEQVHPKFIAGKDFHFTSASLSNEQFDQLREQFARIVGHCAVNADITRRYAAADKLRSISIRAREIE